MRTLKVIAFCNTSSISGIPKYYSYLCSELQDLHVDPVIIVDSEKGKNYLKSIGVNCNKVVVITPSISGRFKTIKNALFSLKVSIFLKRLERKNELIVHTCHSIPFFYLLMNKGTVIYQPFGNEIFHFTKVRSGLSKLYSSLFCWVIRFCGNKSTIVLYEYKEQLPEYKCIYNKQRNFKELKVGIPLVKTINEPTKTIDVLTINSFFDYENMDLLVKEVSKIKDLHLTIVGEGPEKFNIIALAIKLKVKLTVLSNIPESLLQSTISKAKVYVSLSKMKDIQMGVIEAMSHKLPIVTINQTMLVKDGVNGIVCRPDTVANSIEKLICNSSLRTLMGLQSGILSQGYLMDSIAKDAYKLYEDIKVS